MRPTFKLRQVLPFTLALAAAPALAQVGDTGLYLGKIVIGGGLTPIPEAAYGRAYTVVTGDELTERGIATVQDALRGLPGVSVSSVGNSSTSVRIRGGEARHVLVLIDGVEARGGDQAYVFSGLDTANIDRIEVLRGPQSVFYGSAAASGVINIITRKGALGTQYGGTLEAGNGTAASAFTSTRTERGGLAFSFGFRDDQGYDVSGDPGGDDDGILRRTIGASGDFQATDRLQLGFTLRRSVEAYGYDDNAFDATTPGEYVIDSGDYSDRDETTGQLWAELATLDGRLTHRLSAQTSRYDDSYNGGPVTQGTTDKLKYRATYGLDGAVADARQTISFGIDRQRDASDAAPDNERESTSYALEYRGEFGTGLSVQGGLRHDDNKVFDSITTFSLALSYDIPDTGLRVHASGGSGIVNPFYYQLFGGFGAVGNPNLRPERNEGFDLGLEYALPGDRGTIDVTYFNERLTDEIIYTFTPLPDGSNYFNLEGEAPRQGVEVAGSLRPTDDLSLRLAYTWTDAETASGSVAIRRPAHEVSLGATLRTFGGRGTVSGDIRHVADLFDTQFFGDFTTEKLPDFTLVTVAATYDLTDTVRLTSRVENLFDEAYSEVWGYAAPGRTAWVGVDARW